MHHVVFSSFHTFNDTLTSHGLAPKVALLFDRNTHRLFSPNIFQTFHQANIAHSSFVVPASESAKSLRTAERLYGAFIKNGIDRATALVAVGGGVVGDLGGFLAASYLRGIPLVHVPTTLLAMVDSAIGGKVAVNHSLGKNMIGFFYPPTFTFIDVNFLSTLPKRDVYSGLAEAFKYALIQDAPFFHHFESRFEPIVSLERADLERVVARSVKNKLRIVKKDFKETLGLRALLNFGHTFAHALETLSNYKAFRHGEAVLIGMLCASALSKNLDLLDKDSFMRIAHFAKRFPLSPSLLKRYFFDVAESDLELAMQSDKKKSHGTIRFVLLRRIGEAFLCQEKISSRNIHRAILEAKQILT
ncbi:MAG: 3-dehydroquinate synthase [Chloroherpetonaceae bacterium]